MSIEKKLYTYYRKLAISKWGVYPRDTLGQVEILDIMEGLYENNRLWSVQCPAGPDLAQGIHDLLRGSKPIERLTSNYKFIREWKHDEVFSSF